MLEEIVVLSTRRFMVLCTGLAAACFGAVTSANAALIISYEFTGNSPSPTTVAANVSGNDISFGSGTSSGAVTSNQAQAAGMNTGALDLNDYFEISFQPDAGYSLNLTEFSFKYRKGHANSPTNYAVRYSVDSFASNLATGTQTDTFQTATVALSDTGLTGLIRFRIYGWGAAASNRPMIVDDINLQGSVIPEPGLLALMSLSPLLLMRRH